MSQIELSPDKRTLLGTVQSLSPNHSRAFTPRFVTLHYTAGPSLERAVTRFLDPKSQVSAHFVIGHDGEAVQCVPLDCAAWHAGQSFWKPAQGAGRLLGLKGLNRFSFGIEMVNAGPLRKSHGGALHTWWGQQVDPDAAIAVDPQEPGSFGRPYWARYSGAQIDKAIEIVQLLTRSFPIEEILGHSDICPGRKQDPGPAFPMSHIRAIMHGRNMC